MWNDQRDRSRDGRFTPMQGPRERKEQFNVKLPREAVTRVRQEAEKRNQTYSKYLFETLKYRWDRGR